MTDAIEESVLDAIKRGRNFLQNISPEEAFWRDGDMDLIFILRNAENHIQSLQQQLSDSEAARKELEGEKDTLFMALDSGLKGIFPPLESWSDDERTETSARNYRTMKAVRDRFSRQAKHSPTAQQGIET